MKRWGIFGLGLVMLLVALTPAAGAVSGPRFEGFAATFKLRGTNDYDIWVSAYFAAAGWAGLDLHRRHR
jgi:hypothetical protein